MFPSSAVALLTRFLAVQRSGGPPGGALTYFPRALLLSLGQQQPKGSGEKKKFNQQQRVSLLFHGPTYYDMSGHSQKGDETENNGELERKRHNREVEEIYPRGTKKTGIFLYSPYFFETPCMLGIFTKLQPSSILCPKSPYEPFPWTLLVPPVTPLHLPPPQRVENREHE